MVRDAVWSEPVSAPFSLFCGYLQGRSSFFAVSHASHATLNRGFLPIRRSDSLRWRTGNSVAGIRTKPRVIRVPNILDQGPRSDRSRLVVVILDEVCVKQKHRKALALAQQLLGKTCDPRRSSFAKPEFSLALFDLG